MAWKFRSSSPGGGDVFFTRPDWPRSPPTLLCDGHRASFLEAKRPGRGVDHPPASSAEVKERGELYLYNPFGHLWPVTGRNVPLGTTQITVI